HRARGPPLLDGGGVLPPPPLPQVPPRPFGDPAPAHPRVVPPPRGDRRPRPLRHRLAESRRRLHLRQPGRRPRAAASPARDREAPLLQRAASPPLTKSAS